MKVTRSAYLRWLKHPYSKRMLAKVIRHIHDVLPEEGYWSINDILKRKHASISMANACPVSTEMKGVSRPLSIMPTVLQNERINPTTPLETA